MSTIGDQIAAARKKKGMTQEQLAAAMNMSRQGISHWENGRTMPDVEALARLSQTLDCTFALPGAEGQSEFFGMTAVKEELVPENAPLEAQTPEITSDSSPAQENVSTARLDNSLQDEAVTETRESRPSSNGKRPWIIAVAAGILLLIAACLLWVWPGFLKQPASPAWRDDTTPQTHQIADFQAIPENDPESTYLKETSSLSVTENLWLYTFQFHEVNGIGCSVQQTVIVYFDLSGTPILEQVLSAPELVASGAETEIEPYADWDYVGGLPAQPGIKGVGLRVQVTDAQGQPRTFTGWVDFPAE